MRLINWYRFTDLRGKLFFWGGLSLLANVFTFIFLNTIYVKLAAISIAFLIIATFMRSEDSTDL